MIYIKKINHGLVEGREGILYEPAHEVFLRLFKDYAYKFLFESKDISPVYGRLSLVGVDPVLRISGKNDKFTIQVLNDRGSFYLDRITDKDLIICDHLERDSKIISGVVYCPEDTFEETQRSKRKNISQIIRIVLSKFHLNERNLLGLYGAFSYDFVRLFENIPSKLPENDAYDFDLFLYDTFIFFDHLKEMAELIAIRETKGSVSGVFSQISKKIRQKKQIRPKYSITNANFALDKAEYGNLVIKAKDYAKKGELFEVVFSNILKASFKGDPFALYLRYREMNPSPYLFYFDFGKRQLVGASPEMMVRVENGIVHMRPISGTATRGKDPIEDHENMLELLSDQKERAELDMLIDLGRNDLSRICEAGVKVTDYRFVEKYSKVMHTVAHLSGVLRKDFTAFDALLACLNAGTLTGAPKVAAMRAIEMHEKERRDFYGGTIGYLTFSGEMDSGIIIRTADIKGNKLKFQVGATLLYRSIPEKEYDETINKAQAFLNTMSKYNLSINTPLL